MSVAANIAIIREVLGDKPVKLVAVTKNATASQVEEAYQAGVTEFGESKVQDAFKKWDQLSPSLVQNARWHFIGHLQTNKVKYAVGSFSLIHSVDSLRLAREISKVAVAREILQPILLQVKVLFDPAKSGFEPRELNEAFAELMNLPGLEIRGLMTILPLIDDADVWRRGFSELCSVRDSLSETHGVRLEELSMGMTDDWREAVECGSTMVRVGRAIFGDEHRGH